jgi:hypothetical protein
MDSPTVADAALEALATGEGYDEAEVKTRAAARCSVDRAD